jgi:hypothetical protein
MPELSQSPKPSRDDQPAYPGDETQPRQGRQLRWIWRALAAFAVGMTVLGLGIAVWIYARHRQNRLELQAVIDEIRAAGEPLTADELNAYYDVPDESPQRTELYMQAFATMNDRQDWPLNPDARPRIEELRPLLRSNDEWPEREEAERFIEQYQETLDLFHLAALEPGSVRYPIDAREGGIQSPSLLDMVRASDLLRLQLQVRLENGDSREAIDALVAYLALAKTIDQVPEAVWQILRSSIVYAAADDIERFLQRHAFDDQSLSVALEEFSSIEFEHSVVRALIGERAIVFVMASTSEGKASLLDAMPGDCALALQNRTDQLSAARLPLPAAVREAKMIDERLEQFFKESETAAPWNRYPLTGMTSVTVVPLFQRIGNAQAKQRGLIAALAIERFRHANSERLLETLDELVPQYLSAVPDDPFDLRPLRYNTTKQGYVVYSVGADFQDDGGGERDVTVRIERPALEQIPAHVTQ